MVIWKVRIDNMVLLLSMCHYHHGECFRLFIFTAPSKPDCGFVIVMYGASARAVKFLLTTTFIVVINEVENSTVVKEF